MSCLGRYCVLGPRLFSTLFPGRIPRCDALWSSVGVGLSVSLDDAKKYYKEGQVLWEVTYIISTGSLREAVMLAKSKSAPDATSGLRAATADLH